MSREVLHDLLRGELGYDGLVITDALEMRAISATVGVEEGAVRALAAGADALCLGHDLFDESVVSVRDAIVDAVRSGRLPEERLAEAAARVRRAAEWASRGRLGKRVPRGGRARRGPPRGLRSSARSRCRPRRSSSSSSPSRAWPPGGSVRARASGSATSSPRPRSCSSAEAALARANGRPLVIVTRDAHRHEWARDAIEQLVGSGAEAVVVELGLPYWHPSAGGVRRDLRRRARERGSRSGGAILGFATRGGAVW